MTFQGVDGNMRVAKIIDIALTIAARLETLNGEEPLKAGPVKGHGRSSG